MELRALQRPEYEARAEELDFFDGLLDGACTGDAERASSTGAPGS